MKLIQVGRQRCSECTVSLAGFEGLEIYIDIDADIDEETGDVETTVSFYCDDCRPVDED